MRKRTVGADPQVYRPDRKSGSSLLWLGPARRWGGVLLTDDSGDKGCGGMRTRFCSSPASPASESPSDGPGDKGSGGRRTRFCKSSALG